MSQHTQPEPPQLKRILVVKLADLGDLLTVTPALQALRSAHPTATIDLLVPPSSAKLLHGAPFLDRIITFDKFAFDSLGGLLNGKSLIRTTTFLWQLRRAKYDAIIIFHHFTLRWGAFKFKTVALASGARLKVGLDNGRGSFLDRRVRDQGFGAMHEADYWLQVAALTGADPNAGWRPKLPITDNHRQIASELLSGSALKDQRPLVAIHPGTGAYSRARIWPIENFGKVARELARVYNASIVIVGGPDEVDTAERLEGKLSGEIKVLNLAGRTDIHTTAAALGMCDLFVGNDSGPMHIAAAMGVPVVAVFGPSNWRAWGPYTPPGETAIHRVVARDLPCMPCFYRHHSLGLKEGCGTRPCLVGLAPMTVVNACRETLQHRRLQTGKEFIVNIAG